MNQDIDAALRGWEFKANVPQARLVEAGDGRQVIQMRIDLGILQIETTGRPDGVKPHGFPTFFDSLRQQARMAARNKRPFILNEEQCLEADREFVQYYHRRICWMALRNFALAVADADHTLAFMDFVRDHSPDEDYTQAHEQYRGFVVFQRTQAAALEAVDKEDAEGAIDEIRAGLEKMRAFFVSYEVEDKMEEDGMVRQLRQMEKKLRDKHGIESTLNEQLDEAVAKEDYEKAAQLRDRLRGRPGGSSLPDNQM